MEQAYAHVRREALRQAVMTDNSNELSGAVLASKGLKLQSSKIFSQSKHKEPSNGTKCSHCGDILVRHVLSFMAIQTGGQIFRLESVAIQLRATRAKLQ